MSKKMRLYFAVVMSTVILVFAYWNFGRAPRIVHNFNQDWEFHLGDIGVGDFASLEFEKISMPHEFTKNDVGVYRKEFDVSASWEGRSVVLDFSKHSGNVDFWINGAKANPNMSSGAGFEIELSPYLRYGEVNAIAMRLGKDAKVKTSAGIDGPVSLVVKNKLSIVRNGINISVSNEDNLSKIFARVRIINKLTTREVVSVHFKLKDSQGKNVAERELKTGIDGGALAMLSLEMKVENPIISTNQTPKYYTLQVSITKGQKVLDELSSKFEITKK